MKKLVLAIFILLLARAAPAQTIGGVPQPFNFQGWNDILQIGKPATNPVSGWLRVYAKTGSTICVLNNLGAETCFGSGGGGGTTFDQIGSGTNTTANMQVSTGASLSPAGSGTITATGLSGSPSTNNFWGYNGSAQGWYTPALGSITASFSSPLSLSTNTLSCPTCVVASSPGAGIAHFAGSTQTVTSSAVTPSDATGNTSGSGNFCLVTSCVMTTPNLGTPSAATLTSATGLPLSTGVTGTLAAVNFPALLGDATNTAGSLSTTVGKINGGSAPTGPVLGGWNSSAQPFSATAHTVSLPLTCADTSGSGSAQTCTTSPSFSLASGDSIIYKTTTTNTGSLTVTVNGTGYQVRKWLGASTLASADLPSNVPVYMTFDGTYLEMMTIGNAPSGGGGSLTTQVNGTNMGSQTTLNFITSTTNSTGLTNTPSNPGGGGNETTEITGTVNATSGGNGLSNPTAHSIAVTEGSANANLLTSPSTNGLCIIGFNVTASAAVDPTCSLAGVPVVSETGASDTLSYGYRANMLDVNGGSTFALSLPAASGNLASNLPFLLRNRNSGNATITPTTPNNIDGGSSQTATTVLPGWAAWVYQDAGSPINWWSVKVPTFSSFGSTCSNGLTWSTTTNFSCLSAAPILTGASAGSDLGGTYPTSVTVTNLSNVTNNSLANSGLAHAATTVNGQTCTLGSTCTIPFQTNTSGNTSQSGVNFLTSTVNATGLTITPSNPSGIQEKFEITGTALTLGTDASANGTVQVSNGSGGGAHTIFGSAATTSNTILGPSAVISNNDFFYCSVSSTTCTLTDSGISYANLINSSSTMTANAIPKGNGTKTLALSDLQESSNVLSNLTSTQGWTIVGGNDSSGNSGVGAITVRGGNQTGAGGASSAGGSALLAAGSNAATNTGSTAGNSEILAGISNGASSTGLQGLLIIGSSFAQSGTVTQWNLECYTSTAKAVTDCSASPTNIAGVALSKSGSVQVTVASAPSEIPINASAAVTLGDSVCAGTTAGKVTDSGGTTSTCAVGTLVGWVVATSGTWQAFPDGTSFPTLSTTLPLVRLNSAGGGGGGGSSNTITGSGLTQYNVYYQANSALEPAYAFSGIGSAGVTATFTNSSASISATNSFVAGEPVQFTTTGGLPTNFATGTTYYVISTGLSGSAFEVSATYGGGAITAGSAGTGTQTVISVPTIAVLCVASTTTTCQYNGTLTNGSWTWTPGQVLYVSGSSAGALTATAPTTSGYWQMPVASAITATQILINPSLNGVQVQ